MVVLRRGSKGEKVKRLQTRLNQLGHYRGPIDGDYGPGTEKAVRAFQRAKRLKVDGKVGPTNRAALAAKRISIHYQLADEFKQEFANIAAGGADMLRRWLAEDQASASSMVSPVVCCECGALDLEDFYTSKEGGDTLCPGCFQSGVARGQAREAER